MKKKIYLRLSGGLGNQLYQFTFAFYLFERYSYDQIVIDTSGMKSYNEYWGVMLDLVFPSDFLAKFNFSESLLLKCRIPAFGRKLKLDLHKLGFISDLRQVNELSEKVFSKSIYLDGYFENQVVRNDYRNLLKPWLRQDLLLPLDDNIVVVNVRGGEYRRLGITSFDDKEFYRKSIFQMRKMVTNPVFHLISDDVDFAKELLDGICEFSVVHKPDPKSNFQYLYSSKYKILSASTFSKWAAYLGTKDSEVIYYSPF